MRLCVSNRKWWRNCFKVSGCQRIAESQFVAQEAFYQCIRSSWAPAGICPGLIRKNQNKGVFSALGVKDLTLAGSPILEALLLCAFPPAAPIIVAVCLWTPCVSLDQSGHLSHGSGRVTVLLNSRGCHSHPRIHDWSPLELRSTHWGCLLSMEDNRKEVKLFASWYGHYCPYTRTRTCTCTRTRTPALTSSQ